MIATAKRKKDGLSVLLESTLADILTRLRQGRFPLVPFVMLSVPKHLCRFRFVYAFILLPSTFPHGVAGLIFGKDVIVEF